MSSSNNFNYQSKDPAINKLFGLDSPFDNDTKLFDGIDDCLSRLSPGTKILRKTRGTIEYEPGKHLPADITSILTSAGELGAVAGMHPDGMNIPAYTKRVEMVAQKLCNLYEADEKQAAEAKIAANN